MQTALEHTCNTEYDEPCIACVRRRGMRLWQFGFLTTFRTTSPDTGNEPDDSEPDDMRSDIEASQKADERRTRLKKLRQLNLSRQRHWKPTYR